MSNSVGGVGTGLQFRCYDGKTYVRIPEMILQCGENGFMVNVIYVEEPPQFKDEIQTPLKFVATYLHPDTIVDVLSTRS